MSIHTNSAEYFVNCWC